MVDKWHGRTLVLVALAAIVGVFFASGPTPLSADNHQDTTPPTVRLFGYALNETTDDDDYIFAAGESLSFFFHFTESVYVTGNPQLSIDIGGQTRTAEYSKHDGPRVVFAYTVQPEDYDDDGVFVPANSISLNGGTITDGAGNAAALNHFGATIDDRYVVDGVPPTVNAMAITSSTPEYWTYYSIGDTVEVAVTFNEAVAVSGSPQLELDVGGTVKVAQFQNVDGAKVTFSYTVNEGDWDDDGISVGENKLSGEGISDLGGNPAVLDHPSSVTAHSRHRVDGIRPTISSISIETDPGSDETYEIGDKIRVRVTFSEDIDVILPYYEDGVLVTERPELEVNVGGSPRVFRYIGTDGPVVAFTYTVAEGDVDADGISFGENKLTGGRISDLAGNMVKLSHSAVPDNSGHKVDGFVPDTTPPTIRLFGYVLDETTDDDDYIFAAGESLRFFFHFTESVSVTGNPQLAIDIGGQTRMAEYSKHDGPRVDFAYTVQSGDYDDDGVFVAADSMSLNGGTITDGAGNAANLSHFGATIDDRYVVDGVPPTVTAVTITSYNGEGDSYGVGDRIEVTVAFSEDVIVTPPASIEIDVGGTSREARFDFVDGAYVIFGYAVAADDLDEDGVSIHENSLDGEGIADLAGNYAELSHAGVQGGADHKVFPPGGL